jgi:site-specific DNA recombinase
MPIRALGAIRLSRATDESTSPVRQNGRIDWWTGGNDAELVGVAEDLDVSGSVSPFDRDGLGPWLTDRPPHPWDVLVAWKLDRVSRNALDTLTLLKWLDERGKRLVCVDDGLDTATSMGRVLIQLAAIFAEMERSFIIERAQAGRLELRAQGRWPGGVPPFGYLASPIDGGGWALVPDADTAPLVREMARRVIDGASYLSVADWLTASGVPLRRPDAKHGKWAGTTVQRLLSSSVVRWGRLTSKGQTLEHIDYAEPLLDADTAALLDRAMRKRARNGAGRGPTKWLTGIVVCGACGASMYQDAPRTVRGVTYAYYRCSSKTHRRAGCTMPNIRSEVVEEYVEREFLSRAGGDELFERIDEPGVDHTAELEAVNGRIAKLAELFTAGVLDDSDADFTASLAVLKRRKAELSAAPTTVDVVALMPTGVTTYEVWEESDDQARRALLLDRQTRVFVDAEAPRLRMELADVPLTAG